MFLYLLANCWSLDKWTLYTHGLPFTLLLFGRKIVSNSLQPQGLQHARLPCPSLSPGVCSDLGPLSQWCHPTISSSVTLFASCLQSFPESGSILMSQLFASGGQSIGASASVSVLPMNIQGWFPLGLTGWIYLQSKGFSKTLLQHHSLKASILRCSAFFMVQHTWLLEKPQLWLYGSFLAKWCLCFLICCLGLPQLFVQGTSVF